ncbi:hypothetical protein C2S52_009009 [Perilla frutescens var. hirtella]|nr:hypothetical protein C2S52_009009 [Perilla frutescens var. hirtella]
MTTRMEARVEKIEKGLESLCAEFDQWHTCLEKNDQLDDKLDSLTAMMHTMMKGKGPEQGSPSATASHGIHTISEESPGSGAHSTPSEIANKMTLPPFTGKEQYSRALQSGSCPCSHGGCNTPLQQSWASGVGHATQSGGHLHGSTTSGSRQSSNFQTLGSLTSGGSANTGQQRNRPFRQISYQEYLDRRAKGLCFRCNELYSPQHKYADKTLQVIIIAQPDEEDEPKNPEMLQHEVVEEQLCTMELLEWGKSQQLAQQLRLPIDIPVRSEVRLGDGRHLPVAGVCRNFTIQLNLVSFSGTMSMKFVLERRVVTLRGEPTLMRKQVAAERLCKINDVEACWSVWASKVKNSAVLNSIFASQCISEDHSTQFGRLHALTAEFPTVLTLSALLLRSVWLDGSDRRGQFLGVRLEDKAV